MGPSSEAVASFFLFDEGWMKFAIFGPEPWVALGQASFIMVTMGAHISAWGAIKHQLGPPSLYPLPPQVPFCIQVDKNWLVHCDQYAWMQTEVPFNSFPRYGLPHQWHRSQITSLGIPSFGSPVGPL